MNEQSIFVAALEREPGERAQFVDQACANNSALRKRVEILLHAHEKAGSLLNRPAAQPLDTADRDVVTERPGGHIGPYKLRERLGEGGMGVVWAAEQKHPLRRKVALKVIKPGMDSSQIVARFEAEREALAIMDHTNIARVLDAGTTEQGRPYFVMELIPGVPITDYCDAHKLSVRQRLMLFTQVCNAVQHAHQKGIIHRDIKPSNVLVTEQEGIPVPKVIDFGVAKALHQPLTDRTIYTGVFQAIGTLAYMSPEQAALSSTNVDTRADIYGLGVLLYELLTGDTPLGRQLEHAALDEACRVIREQDPLKPSSRISTLGEEAASVSHGRSTDSKALSKAVHGELDWIVMKALEKERSRRFESAKEFADDVQRHLDDEHVLASPPSVTYRLKKTLRRHRGPIATISVILLCLVGGIIGTSWGWYQANNVMARLKVELQAKAIAAAMNCDVIRMRAAVEDAKVAGATEAWAMSVEAIHALFSGNTELAVAKLSAAKECGEDTLAVHGLLGLAYLGGGNAQGYVNECNYLLKGRKPERFQDILFYAMAVAYVNPEISYNLANEAFDLNRSPVALVVRSRARAVMASETGNLVQVEQAITDATAATVLLPESPAALADCLFAHMLALNLRSDAAGESDLGRHIASGRELSERLMAYPRFARGHWFAAEFYMEIGDLPKARQRYEILQQISDAAYFKDIYVQFLLRQNEVEAATEKLTESGLNPLSLGSYTVVAANAEEMRSKVRNYIIKCLHEIQVAESDDNFSRPRLLGLLCLLGFGEDAEQEASKIHSSQTERNLLCKELFLQFSGESNNERLLDLAAGKRNVLCTVHLLIACRMFSQYDIDHARLELKKCRAMVGHVDYELARTILDRMEDDAQWPGWMSDGSQ